VISAATLRKLGTLGLSAEQMAGVLDLLADQMQADEERARAEEAKREKDRERKRLDRPLRLPESEWATVRTRILGRDDFVCTYCGDINGPWCVDHVVPLSRGGTNTDYNLVACCIPCNSSKGNLLLSEWKGRNK